MTDNVSEEKKLLDDARAAELEHVHHDTVEQLMHVIRLQQQKHGAMGSPGTYASAALTVAISMAMLEVTKMAQTRVAQGIVRAARMHLESIRRSGVPAGQKVGENSEKYD